MSKVDEAVARVDQRLERHRRQGERVSKIANRGVLSDLPGKFTATSLSLPADLSYETWEQVGGSLRYVEGSVRWWLGDWLNFGEEAYGEKYAQAIDETDFAYQSLRNAAWVAGQVEVSRRRDTLSWSHHAEVAALEPAEADALLVKAYDRSWSVADLRREVKGEFGDGSEPKTCSCCGQVIR